MSCDYEQGRASQIARNENKKKSIRRAEWDRIEMDRFPFPFFFGKKLLGNSPVIFFLPVIKDPRM